MICDDLSMISDVFTGENIVEELESIMSGPAEQSSPSWVCIPQKSLPTACDFWNTNSVGWTLFHIPDSKVHGANMGPIWVLSAPDGPHEPCYQGWVPMMDYLYLIWSIPWLLISWWGKKPCHQQPRRWPSSLPGSLKSLANPLFVQTFVQANIKEKIKYHYQNIELSLMMYTSASWVG